MRLEDGADAATEVAGLEEVVAAADVVESDPRSICNAKVAFKTALP